jgi:hypothetical protein
MMTAMIEDHPNTKDPQGCNANNPDQQLSACSPEMI